jgi:hypothetical protein
LDPASLELKLCCDDSEAEEYERLGLDVVVIDCCCKSRTEVGSMNVWKSSTTAASNTVTFLLLQVLHATRFTTFISEFNTVFMLPSKPLHNDLCRYEQKRT